MAGKIRGITIEIGADTKGVSAALSSLNGSISKTKSQLKDVEKLLKMNPGNTELIQQKQRLLAEQVQNTKDKLEELKRTQATMDAQGVDKTSAQYMALQREIIDTENQLRSAEEALESFNRELNPSRASKFSAALQKVSTAAKTISEKTKEAAQKTRVLSTAAAGALTAIGGVAYKAAKNADELNTLAKQTGFTTEELQKMQYASDRIDVSMDTITSAAARLTKQLGTNESKITDLGVSTRDANGDFRSTSDIFYDTIQALSEVENETERDTLAMDIFGKSANELAGIIDDGGEALRDFGKEAEDVGAIMDQETLDSLNEVNDEIDRLKAKGAARIAQAGAKALKALTPVIDKVAGAIEKVLDFIGQLTPQQIGIIAGILALIAAISPLLSLISGISAAIAFLATPVGIAIAAIAALIAIGVLIYKNWDKIKAKAIELGKKVASAWESLKANTAAAWQNMKAAVSTAVENAKAAAQTAVENIKTKVSSVWDTIKSKTKSAWASIKSAITKPIEEAKSTISGIINTIKGFFPISLGKIFTNIKLPRFKVTGGEAPYGLGGKGTMPSISIEWFRKAMKNAYVLDGATIFGAMGGRMLGGGESGKELVISYDKLAEMVGGGQTVINMTINPSPGMDERALANMVAKRIQESVNRKAAVWA